MICCFCLRRLNWIARLARVTSKQNQISERFVFVFCLFTQEIDVCIPNLMFHWCLCSEFNVFNLSCFLTTFAILTWWGWCRWAKWWDQACEGGSVRSVRGRGPASLETRESCSDRSVKKWKWRKSFLDFWFPPPAGLASWAGVWTEWHGLQPHGIWECQYIRIDHNINGRQ